MKQFLVGSAFLMFISSLPADATNTHAISLKSSPVEPQKISFMQAFGDTLPPIGYVTFCREHRDECRPGRRFADRVQLTSAKFRELAQVNDTVNDAVAPVTDLELYGKVEMWTYPQGGKGDCEDYVLLKRKRLIERGWPTGTLLVTVVFDEIGDGHAVLLARTTLGDFVLDNKTSKVRRWYETAYHFVKRQSVDDPNHWVSIGDPRWTTQNTATFRQ